MLKAPTLNAEDLNDSTEVSCGMAARSMPLLEDVNPLPENPERLTGGWEERGVRGEWVVALAWCRSMAVGEGRGREGWDQTVYKLYNSTNRVIVIIIVYLTESTCEVRKFLWYICVVLV